MKYIDYNEKKQHGTEDFPVEYYFVNKEYFQYVMPLHWHTEFEILLVDSGLLELYIDNAKHELYAGDFAFIECGALHRATPHDAVYRCLVFSPSILRGKKNSSIDRYLSPITSHSLEIKSVHRHSDRKKLFVLITELLETARKHDKYYELEICSLLYRLFATLYKEEQISPKNSKQKNSSRNKTISELLDWIDIHYTEQISLKELSEASGLSEKYLCRVFKSYTSRSPMEYINQLRISHVCRILETSEATVTEAAFSCGFNNLSYFSKIFKKYKSESPRQYAKRFSNGTL